jgi:hypothetical protein
MPDLLGYEAAATREAARPWISHPSPLPRPLQEDQIDNGKRYPESVRA